MCKLCDEFRCYCWCWTLLLFLLSRLLFFLPYSFFFSQSKNENCWCDIYKINTVVLVSCHSIAVDEVKKKWSKHVYWSRVCVFGASSRYNFYVDSLFISMAVGTMELLFDHFLPLFLICCCWCGCRSFFSFFLYCRARVFRLYIYFKYTHAQRFFLTLELILITTILSFYHHRLWCVFWFVWCLFHSVSISLSSLDPLLFISGKCIVVYDDEKRE